jgi:protein SERAC1
MLQFALCFANTSLSIVFVHGLTGNRESTWTYNKSLFWPRDLLVKDVPDTRILTFGYDADVVGILKTAGSNTVRDHGKSLAQDLAMLRLRSKSVCYLMERLKWN